MQKDTHLAVQLRCENLVDPIGIDEVMPRLSWQIKDERRGARQTAYQIVVASSRAALNSKPDLWDSGRIKSDQCLDIEYAGKRLCSRQQAWWQVRVWDADGKPSEWSLPAYFEMGLLKQSDWTGKWIGRPIESREDSQPCPMLRKGFHIRKEIRSARIYVTARGLFELHLNGRRVGNDYFTPGWTDYKKRIQYLVYDTTDLLKPGENLVGAVLGDGWYAGYLVWEKNHFVYGDQLSLLLQIEIQYADGTTEVIATDPSWKTSFGPILKSDIYHGETYDARLAMPGWNQPGWDDSSWQNAVVFPAPAAKLVAKKNLPVRQQETLAAIGQTEPQFGVHVFDLGQNMVGWARIKVRAASGVSIKVRHAEMLNDDGTLYTTNLRSARCTDVYVCKGEGVEVFEPHFTFHGFRYVELTGVVEKPQITDVLGIVMHSEIPLTGTFECSDQLVNRLQQNIRWGQKGNFLEVPTDCPQRDERLGWTGDAQVFSRTASFNRDVSAFFEKWCEDLTDSQNPDGAVPHVVPNVLKKTDVAAAAWADAAVICPWVMYLCYGNKRILERQYSSMTKWIGWQKKHSPGLINSSACFGDWLAIDTKPTPADVIATAFFAHTTEIVAKTAEVLGRKADARKYDDLARRIKKAFCREFVTASGRILGDTQTSYLLALAFDLLPERMRAAAFARLVKDIEGRNWHLSTGFVGGSLLAPVLSRFGRTDIAYRLLFQQTYPSWLYPVLQGATTIWERWNSYTKENGFGDAAMNSFNHYAYGAIGEWLYNTVAGIDLDPSKPGYKHIVIRPQVSVSKSEHTLSWAAGELETRYGKVACSWKLNGAKLLVDIVIPANTIATICLPGRKPQKVEAGKYKYELRM